MPIFLIATSRYATGMMILQIRSMLPVLVQCADARRHRSAISAAAHFSGRRFVF
jgi:hypothetical protein